MMTIFLSARFSKKQYGRKASKNQIGGVARETLLLDVPHRQVVLTIPKMLRFFFKFNRSPFYP
jgi:hypothetical protein